MSAAAGAGRVGWVCWGLADLAAAAALADDYRGVLSPAERRRGERYARPEWRDWHAVGRGLLRFVLAPLVGGSAAALRLGIAPGGRPELRRPAAPADFNVTHSGPIWGVAVGCGFRVGIDLERVRPTVDAVGIGRRFFTAAEAAWIEEEAAAAARLARFFRLWTAKEAVLKAWGVGLGGGLEKVDVLAWARGDGPAVVAAGGARWTVHGLAPGPGVVGAVAVRCDAVGGGPTVGELAIDAARFPPAIAIPTMGSPALAGGRAACYKPASDGLAGDGLGRSV